MPTRIHIRGLKPIAVREDATAIEEMLAERDGPFIELERITGGRVSIRKDLVEELELIAPLEE